MQEGYINGEFVVIITDHGNAGIVERSKSWNIHLLLWNVATMILKLASNRLN